GEACLPPTAPASNPSTAGTWISQYAQGDSPVGLDRQRTDAAGHVFTPVPGVDRDDRPWGRPGRGPPRGRGVVGGGGGAAAGGGRWGEGGWRGGGQDDGVAAAGAGEGVDRAGEDRLGHHRGETWGHGTRRRATRSQHRLAVGPDSRAATTAADSTYHRHLLPD